MNDFIISIRWEEPGHAYSYKVDVRGFFPTTRTRTKKLLKIISLCPEREEKRAEFREKIKLYADSVNLPLMRQKILQNLELF